MKKTRLKKISVVTLAALFTGTSAYAAESGKGTVANLTLKLTEYLTDPALLLKDENGKVVTPRQSTFENEFSVESSSKSVYTYEYGSKIMIYKISNKEFLTALVEEVGLIPEIKGWALVMVERDGDNTAFITKKGETPKNVSQYLYSEWGDAGAEQESYKSVETETETSFSEKETGSFKAKYLVGVYARFPSTTIDLQGVYDESWTLKTFGKGEDQYTQWIPGARSVNSISGSLIFEEEGDDGEPSVVTGSISVAAGKQVDLASYPGLPSYPDL